MPIQPDCTWLCARVTQVPKVVESSSEAQKTRKSSSLHSKTIFLRGGCGFFMSDVISGGLLGHLGPLYLVLGPNR